MNREYNHYLNVEGSQISISEEQYDHLTLITYNARIKIEKHIERYFTTEIEGQTLEDEMEVTNVTLYLTKDDLLFIFKTEFE